MEAVMEAEQEALVEARLKRFTEALQKKIAMRRQRGIVTPSESYQFFTGQIPEETEIKEIKKSKDINNKKEKVTAKPPIVTEHFEDEEMEEVIRDRIQRPCSLSLGISPCWRKKWRQCSMKEDLQLVVNVIRREVHKVGGRLNVLEEKTDDQCHANDCILEKTRTLEAEQVCLTTKLADPEDRSCRNNIRVRGVPESILGVDIPGYLQQLFKAIHPTLELTDLCLDRADRVPQPASLAHDIPRDIVTGLHYFNAKEAILTAQHQSTAMPSGYGRISLFADLSSMTMT
ncbi:Hypothetical predicted protein [Pelobates cultripes]|uniref:Uncharacterized protein n=1 Tax=Pelobates cultripes TaxID=61616 RepID=A0AAD1WIH7_PELCU|nr:Hypothetical predicted protein [Pelobates cultripes]